jgi:flagellar hook assembly protein FlgD
MAGRRRTIDRKGQRADFDEDTEKVEDEEKEDEEEGDEDEDEDEEGDDVEADADEDSGDDDDDDSGDDDDDEDAPKKKKKPKAKAKKEPAKRTRATKKVVRQKAVWVIFDNSNKQIETFAFNEKPAAEKLLAEKSEDKKGFYLQMVKVPLDS